MKPSVRPPHEARDTQHNECRCLLQIIKLNACRDKLERCINEKTAARRIIEQRDYCRTCDDMSNSGSPPHTCGWRMCLTYCPKSPSINLPTSASLDIFCCLLRFNFNARTKEIRHSNGLENRCITAHSLHDNKRMENEINKHLDCY